MAESFQDAAASAESILALMPTECPSPFSIRRRFVIEILSSSSRKSLVLSESILLLHLVAH